MAEDNQSISAQIYRFSGIEFNATTGELRMDNSVESEVTAATSKPPKVPSGSKVTRLPPKPARLLALLLERQGELLTHEEIQAELWPDVEIEFDQGVHFCIRQIRSALGDSAASPRFIQTLPRRGYQWMTAVQTPTELDSPSPELMSNAHFPDGLSTSGVETTSRRLNTSSVLSDHRRLWWSRVALLFAVLLGVWFATASFRDQGRVRVAIMPFAPPSDARTTVDTRQIATHLVARLTADSRFDVIGPTTTEQYIKFSPASMRELIREFKVDYIINGRFAERDGTIHMLTELIRAEDGAHVWVSWFDDLDSMSEIAETIALESVARMVGAAISGRTGTNATRRR